MIQLQFINYLLNSNDTNILSENNLDESYFSDYKNEYRFIKEHIDKYQKIPDKETFLSTFENFDFIEVEETPKYLLDKLIEDKNTRILAETFNKIKGLILSGKTEEAINLFQNKAQETVKEKKMSCVDIFEDFSRYDKYVDRCNDFNKYYISTGFKELDMLIGGWDRYEELATIAARPGIGKSYIALKCAIAAAKQGLNVGLYSGEMSENKVGYRADTLLSHISNSSLIHGNIQVQKNYKDYIDSIKKEIPGSLKILTPNMINGSAGVTALKAFVEKEKLDILFVDQHSLLNDDRNARNPVERAANISRDLKNLQVLEKIPIIAVSQQNRSSTENGVDTSHIAQSDRISQDSTIIIFLEQKDSVLTMELAKVRDGANNKKLKYAVDFDKGIFTFIPEETNKEDGEELRKEFESDNGEDEF